MCRFHWFDSPQIPMYHVKKIVFLHHSANPATFYLFIYGTNRFQPCLLPPRERERARES
jgi:hypothetical protein